MAREKRYRYDCDGGCILIGNDSTRISIPNAYGDGSHYVYVRSVDYPNQYEALKKYDWVGVIRGNRINVYDYDCYGDNEINDKANILCTLNGSYSVYVSNNGNGNIVLQERKEIK